MRINDCFVDENKSSMDYSDIYQVGIHGGFRFIKWCDFIGK